MHINIALSRALANQRDHTNGDTKNKMKTGSLSQEVKYHLSPKHNPDSEFGAANVDTAFFVLFLNASQETEQFVVSELDKSYN